MDLPFDLTLMNKMQLIENYFRSVSLFLVVCNYLLCIIGGL